MRLIKLIITIVLAAIIVVAVAALLVLGYGASTSGNWETVGLDHGSTGGDWLWLDGEPIYYRTWGSHEDTPLVLVHGLDQGGLAVWEELGPRLSRYGYYVIALDLPGLGRSTRSGEMDYTLGGQAVILATALNEMGAQGGYLVTHGWGAAVALAVATEQPQFARALVLINPELDGDVTRLERWSADIPYVGHPVAWLQRAGGPVWEWLVRQSAAGTSDALNAYIGEARQTSHALGSIDAWLEVYAASEEMALSGGIVVQQPVTALIPFAGQDDAEPPAIVNELPPSVTQIMVRGGGAWLPLDMPAEIAAQIAESLTETD